MMVHVSYQKYIGRNRRMQSAICIWSPIVELSKRTNFDILVR